MQLVEIKLNVFGSQTVEILKKELKRRNISIIAVEGFGWRGGVSFQMEKLKVKSGVTSKVKSCASEIQNE